jgi:hypothetical protein
VDGADRTCRRWTDQNVLEVCGVVRVPEHVASR